MHIPSSWTTRVVATSLLSVIAALSLNHSSAQALRSGTWSWPVTGPHTISRNYSAPTSAYSPGHRGIDLVASSGTEILSPADGVVHFAGWVVDRPVLSIEHEGLLSTFEPVEALVMKGEKVSRGQVIGLLGSGAHCSCLHMGARQGEDYLSPLAMLSSVPAAVLLPWD